MDRRVRAIAVLGVLLVGSLKATGPALANGGPFLVKYPNGDPSAKGVLARLDPDLKPARETRLRVTKEDLKVTFAKGLHQDLSAPPLADIEAAYTIENPTAEEIEIDFGFPILRGVYVRPDTMQVTPEVRVSMNEKLVGCDVISNSAIYGLIRQRAREVIEKALTADPALAKLVAAVRGANEQSREAARSALTDHLTGQRKWTERDAALMVEYTSLDFGKTNAYPPDRSLLALRWHQGIINANLGALGAIGEQKAAQFFARLASRFDPRAASDYEAIFTAWGGEVRERSVDLRTGQVRPRELTLDPQALKQLPPEVRENDPTVYARVNYLDENARISEAEKASCRAILKNLPVVFTFAPMNLLHYQAKFPPEATQNLTVTYKQFAYADTREPSSFQVAYVVHPASLWGQFGRINLQVAAPVGVPFRASVACEKEGTEVRSVQGKPQEQRFALYRGTVKEKTGELFLAVEAAAWKKPLSEEEAERKMAQYRASRRVHQPSPKPLPLLSWVLPFALAAALLALKARRPHGEG